MEGGRRTVAGVRTPLRLLTLLVVLVLAPEPPTQDPAHHTVTGFGPRFAAIIPWAVDLYAEAGLRLPGVDFVHHGRVDGCNGGRGWYSPGEDGRARVDICVPDGNVSAERLVLHELAHAWDAANLTTSDHAALLAEWGVERWWDDGSREWGEFAAEQTAEIIAWGLSPEPLRLSRIPVRDCDHLHDAYVALTGDEPLHGRTELCALDSRER